MRSGLQNGTHSCSRAGFAKVLLSASFAAKNEIDDVYLIYGAVLGLCLFSALFLAAI